MLYTYDQLPPEIVALVADRDANPITEAKRAALQAGQPLPIECGDFIKWMHSFRVCGWVVGEESLKVGKKAMPHWKVWNPLAQEYQHIAKHESELRGYA